MNNKKILGILGFAMIVLLGIGFVSSFQFGSGISDEEKQMLKNSIDSGDYESWASLKKAQISPERFEEMRNRHLERENFRASIQEAKNSGDYTKIQDLKNEFGQGKNMKKNNLNLGNCPFSN